MRNRESGTKAWEQRVARIGGALFLLLLMGGWCAGAETPEAFLDVNEILDTWQKNYVGIPSQKVRVSYRITEGAEPGEATCHCVARIDAGKRFHVWETKSPLGFEEKENVIITSFDGRVSKEFLPQLKRARMVPGRIDTVAAVYNPLAFVLGTKLSFVDPNRALPGSSLRTALQSLREEYPDGMPSLLLSFSTFRQFGQVFVRPELESVAGVMCHVVEGRDRGGSYRETIWFAHDKGMLRMKTLSELSQTGLHCTRVTEIASAATEKGVLWYPRRAVYEGRKAGTGAIERSVTEVLEFSPYIKVPDGTFDITFPPGTSVDDSTTGRMHDAGEGAPTN
jgi:hypothetical protein